jgi:5-methylcytosine-specific restriction endonuclease McrA
MQRVIVLNSDYSILGTTTFKRAIALIVKEKAVAVAQTAKKVHDELFAPLVIRLIKAIRNLWGIRVPWNKNNVAVRDNYVCQFCGKKLNKKTVTIDHVIPKCQGGGNKWGNTVASCKPCNNRKGNKTPSEAKMPLLRQPYTPTIMEFIQLKIKAEGLNEILKDLKVY